MNHLRLAPFAIVAALSLAACGPSPEHRAADSSAAVLSTQRSQLADQLAALPITELNPDHGEADNATIDRFVTRLVDALAGWPGSEER